MAKYLVTRGTSFIYSNVVEALVNIGENVIVIDNLVTNNIKNLAPIFSKIKFVEGCITDSVWLEAEK